MKFAAIPETAPGDTFEARCQAIAAAGCQGLETLVYAHSPLPAWQAEVSRATANTGLELVTVILGGGLDLYEPEKLAWVREALPAVAEVEAAAMLTPEYRAQDPLPLFPPYPEPASMEQAQVDRALAEIRQIATRLKMQIFLEPLTQFESRFWRNVETVLAVCRSLDSSRVKLCLDFHNMNITEASIEGSIRRAGRWVGHIHLADNNRRLPGHGHIDFAAGLSALQEIGYAGWYTFECGIGHDFQQEVQETINRLEQLVRNTHLQDEQ